MSSKPLFEIRDRLIDVAKRHTTIYYSELMHEFHLPRGGHENTTTRVGDVVGRISEFEHENGRPLLSSIVVHKSDNYPGGGFFGLDGIPNKLQRVKHLFGKPLSKADKEFVKEEQNRVWEWWTDQIT